MNPELMGFSSKRSYAALVSLKHLQSLRADCNSRVGRAPEGDCIAAGATTLDVSG